MAGESARAVALRQRARAARLLCNAQQFERGAEGEEATAQVLTELPSGEWRVFHDVRWPGRKFANIDHVLVGPQGVFVVDTKAWTGEIEVHSGVLRQNRRRRTKAVAGATSAAQVVSELVPALAPDVVKSVLCFVRPQPVFGWVDAVMVCSTQNIVTLLTSRPRILDERAVRSTSEALAQSLRSATSTRPDAGTGPARTDRARTDRARRTRSERNRDSLGRPLAVVAFCALLVLLVLMLDVPSRLGELGAQTVDSMKNPTKSVGEKVTLDGTGDRPDLSLIAERPVVTRSTQRRVHLDRGHQFVAVPMTVHNAGDQAWVFAPSASLVLRDDTQATYWPDARVTKIFAGRVLPAAVTLRPGGTTRGSMVFDVPRGTTITAIELTLGSGDPRTIRWLVG